LFIAVVIPEWLQRKTVVVVCQWAILLKSDGAFAVVAVCQCAILLKSDGAYHGQDGKKEAVEHLGFFF
jgi:hypothetical protein